MQALGKQKADDLKIFVVMRREPVCRAALFVIHARCISCIRIDFRNAVEACDVASSFRRNQG